MEPRLYPEQALKLNLTPSVLQSLTYLQLASYELSEYIQDIAISNPLLEITPPTMDSIPTPNDDIDIGYYRDDILDGFSDLPLNDRLFTNSETFQEYLSAQLRQMSLLDSGTLEIALYLVGCLDSRGYLDCALEDLSEETGVDIGTLEQALFVIQMLDPPGVGARSLSECLVLQLAQGPHFNQITLYMAQEGLSLLAKKNYEKLGQLLHADKDSVLQAADVISSLYPIPSYGFDTQDRLPYIYPDALLTKENGGVSVAINGSVLPQITINQEYVSMLDTVNDAETDEYIRKKLTEANDLISGVTMRKRTLLRLIDALIEIQKGFFIYGRDLKPLTMQQLADYLNVSTSTISRAVNGKYILFDGKRYPLKDFFSMPVHTKAGDSISAKTVKLRIKSFIDNEDKTAPLSDQMLHLAMESSGIHISRRTITKYRTELHIPSANERRRK